MPTFAIYCLTFFLVLNQLQAEIIQLFDHQGNQVKNYDKLVSEKNLKRGDVFKFSDGSQFLYEEVLGKGSRTLILKVKPLQRIQESIALRLPLKYGSYVSGGGMLGSFMLQYTQSITSYINGQKSIEKIGMNMPKLYSSLPYQYAAVELIKYDFDGFTFFSKEHSVSPTTLKEAEIALEKFVEDTSKFSILDDFHPGQMVYNKEKKLWYLIDWASSNYAYVDSFQRSFKRHPFNRGFFQTLSIRTDKKSNPIYFIWPELVLRRNLSKRELRLFHKIYKMTSTNRKCLTGIIKKIAK